MAVEIQAGDRSFTVSIAADLIAVFDELAETITAPTLIAFRAPDTVLHVGVGHASASVALFLDAEQRAFFAEGGNSDAGIHADLSFDQNGVVRHFYRSAAISPTEAHNAAIDFVTGDRVKPPGLHWVAEGLPDAAQ